MFIFAVQRRDSYKITLLFVLPRIDFFVTIHVLSLISTLDNKLMALPNIRDVSALVKSGLLTKTFDSTFD